MLIVLVGPSGVGKGTLAVELRARLGPRAVASISATTRPPRTGERHGEHYFFMERGAFESEAAAGRFAEHARFDGHWYGTPAAFLEDALARELDVVMDIDVQGAKQLMSRYPQGAYFFILPPSEQALEARLRGRGRDDEATVARRLEIARAELARLDELPYRVVNDRVEDAVARILDLLERHRADPEARPDPPSGR